MKFIKTYQLFENKKEEGKSYVNTMLKKTIEANDLKSFNVISKEKYSKYVDYKELTKYIFDNPVYFEFINNFPQNYLNSTNIYLEDVIKDPKNPRLAISLDIFSNGLEKDTLRSAVLFVMDNNSNNIHVVGSNVDNKKWLENNQENRFSLLKKYIEIVDNPNQIDEEDFDSIYKPQINHIERAKPKYVDIADEDLTGYSGTLYETYGEDVEYVLSIARENIKKVWTLDDSDGIYAGYHRVNRMGYFITEKEWVTGNEFVEAEKWDDD